MAWVVIPDTVFEAGKPARAIDMRNLRDNFAALANGDSGAPRVQLAALETGFYTAGGVGSYMWARRTSGTGDVAFGGVLAGSSLSPTSASEGHSDGGGTGSGFFALGAAQSGSWRCMGNYDHTTGTGGTSLNGSSLWLRIA